MLPVCPLPVKDRRCASILDGHCSARYIAVKAVKLRNEFAKNYWQHRFYVGGFAPKSTTPDQLLPYGKRISANVKHPSVPYTYAFIVSKTPHFLVQVLYHTCLTNGGAVHFPALVLFFHFPVSELWKQLSSTNTLKTHHSTTRLYPEVHFMVKPPIFWYSSHIS